MQVLTLLPKPTRKQGESRELFRLLLSSQTCSFFSFSSGVFDPFKNSGLLNFRSFADLAKSAGHPSYEAKDKLFAEYSAYRLEFQKRLLKTFFEEHCDKVWFKEKYFYKDADGYDYEEDRKMRIKKGREGRKEIWVKELQAGEIDEVNWDLKGEFLSCAVCKMSS